MKKIKKKGFTLIEMIAVIVMLGIILAIAVPKITGVIKQSLINAFESDAKLLLKAVDYKKLEVDGFDPTSVDQSTLGELLGLSSNNYSNINIVLEDSIPVISIIGAGKWDGLIACGTYKNMKVVENATECSEDNVFPKIVILGDNPTNIYINNEYSDAGATASDNLDGDLTSDLIITSNVNPNVPGIYIVTYSATDSAGNETVLNRAVNIIDNIGPMVTFGTDGNSIYTKSRSTTVSVSDVGGINESNLNYLWTTSLIEPNESTITDTFTNNQTINTPVSVTGTYYLWILAKDTSGNQTIVRTNVFNLDNTNPVITISGSLSVTINKGSTYNDAGATALDNIDGTISVTATGSVNPSIAGSYTITYNATDSSGNVADTVTRTIDVVDVLAPVITLLGSNPANINVESTYSDAGATALDDVDGNVTSKITTTGTVTPTVVGSYTITYTVKDNANNTSSRTRTVNVIDNVLPTVVFGTNGNATYGKTRSTTITVSDAHSSVNASSLKYLWKTSTTPPSEVTFTTAFTNGAILNTPSSVTGTYYLWILAKDTIGNTTITRTNAFNLDNTKPIITLTGSSSVLVNVGTAYTDAGATAIDNINETITSSIVKTSTVNTAILGTYTVTYNVSDSSGNAATTVTRTVNVIDNVIPTVAFGTNGNATYAKTRSTTITVSDNVYVNASSLKYLWNTSTTVPTEASITTAFTNGGTLSTPVGVTGSYYLWILAKDTSGNTTITRSNAFNLDNTKPVITLTGSSSVSVNAGSTYSDAGATATDNINGTLTSSIVKTSTVNTAVLGTYTVNYNVSDSSGNAATTVTRTVTVVDGNPPTVVANATSYTITQGGSNALPGSYFTINKNGLANISSTVCIDTSNGNVTVSNTSTLAVGTHVVRCTTTKTTGLSAYATTSIVVIPIENVFNPTTSLQTYTAPVTGNYKFEVWGAQGGGAQGGKGGYSTGTKRLNAGDKLYVEVGKKGSYSTSSNITIAGGYGGGGSSRNDEYGYFMGAASGGGASTIFSQSEVKTITTENTSSTSYFSNINLEKKQYSFIMYGYYGFNNIVNLLIGTYPYVEFNSFSQRWDNMLVFEFNSNISSASAYIHLNGSGDIRGYKLVMWPGLIEPRLIVAGGGGGQGVEYIGDGYNRTLVSVVSGGYGGGTQGGPISTYGGGGGNQNYISSAYLGGSSSYFPTNGGRGFGGKGETGNCGGGGGGYVGGTGGLDIGYGSEFTAYGGGGGSGYIGGVTDGSMESGTRQGDGYVKITYIGQ